MLWSVAEPARAERYVIAVGVNAGNAAERPLRYAERDATRFAQLLKKRADVAGDNVTVLLGKKAQGVLGALAQLTQRLTAKPDPEATVFVYYSGHADTRDLHVAGARIPIDDVKAQIALVPARVKVAVIDACRGTTDEQRKGFGRTKGFAVNLRAPAGLSGVVTLRSSSEGEDSQESEKLRGGVFTHYLLTALRGAADRDRDRRVTLSEAYTYAYRQTVRRSAASSGAVMHPTIDVDLKGAGELILTRTRAASARLTLPAGADVRYVLFAKPSGSVVAEVWSQPRQAIALSVPAGRYLLHRRAGEAGGAYEFRIEQGAALAVSEDVFQPVPVATLAAKGGGLSLWNHELSAGYGGLLTHLVSYGHSVRLRYGYGAWDWTVALGLELGTTHATDSAFVRDERWVGGTLMVHLRELLGPLDLRVGAAWRVVDQRLTRRDAAALVGSGYKTEQDYVGFAGGPTLGVAWRALMPSRWFIDVAVGATGWIRGEGGAVQFRPEGSASLMVGVTID